MAVLEAAAAEEEAARAARQSGTEEAERQYLEMLAQSTKVPTDPVQLAEAEEAEEDSDNLKVKDTFEKYVRKCGQDRELDTGEFPNVVRYLGHCDLPYETVEKVCDDLRE